MPQSVIWLLRLWTCRGGALVVSVLLGVLTLTFASACNERGTTSGPVQSVDSGPAAPSTPALSAPARAHPAPLRTPDASGPAYPFDDSERARAIEATLEKIKKGGPFPYRQDGVVFENREGRLPGRPRGYYKEYTVATPGVQTRGARRIVAGKNGELYYTDDHYRSFVPVEPPKQP